MGIIIFYLCLFLFLSYFRLISFTVAPMRQVEVASRQSRTSNYYDDGLETLHTYGSGCISTSLSALFYCLFLFLFVLFCFEEQFAHPSGCDVPSSALIAEHRNPASSVTRSSKDFFPIPKSLKVESVNFLISFQTCPYLATTIPGIMDEQEMSGALTSTSCKVH